MNYPQIDPKMLVPLRIIAAELAENPGYLDDESCPYDPDLKDFLSVFGPQNIKNTPQTGPKSSFLGSRGDKWAAMEGEAAALYQELKDFGENLSVDDVAERMSYFRTSTSLLEKIISINERAMGLKQIHEFQQTVLDVIENVLTTDQRTKVMGLLKASIDGKETDND